MPRIMIPLQSVDDMVSRPVVFDIVRQLMKHTNLPENALVLFPGAEGRVPLNQSTIDSEQEEVAHFHQQNQIVLEVNETVEEDAVLTRAVFRTEHIPVIIDQNLQVEIKPVYTHTTVEINFSNRFRDRHSAERWLNEMRTRIAMSRDVILHKATYSYTVPLTCIAILQEIHRLREEQGGYNQDFDEYVRLCSSPNVTDITNVGGKVSRLGVAETQQRIIGQFDFREEPEKGSRDGDGDNWLVGFTYKFRYDKPVACTMDYPIVIHNQLLPVEYLPERKAVPSNRLVDTQRSGSNSLHYLSYFESDREWYENYQRIKGIQIPEFDEWVPYSIPEGTYRMVTYLVGISEEDRIGLFNLEEMPGTEPMDPVLKEFFLQELKWMTYPTKSVFNVSLYQERDRLHERNIRIDVEGNLLATTNLDIRMPYRVRVGVYWDWRLLDKDARDRLRVRPDVVEKLICGLYPQHCGIEVNKINDKYISLDEFDRIVGILTDPNYLQQGGMKTVQTLFIEAERKPENEVATVEFME